MARSLYSSHPSRRCNPHQEATYQLDGSWTILGASYDGDVVVIGRPGEGPGKPSVGMSYPCSFRDPDNWRHPLVIVPLVSRLRRRPESVPSYLWPAYGSTPGAAWSSGSPDVAWDTWAATIAVGEFGLIVPPLAAGDSLFALEKAEGYEGPVRIARYNLNASTIVDDEWTPIDEPVASVTVGGDTHVDLGEGSYLDGLGARGFVLDASKIYSLVAVEAFSEVVEGFSNRSGLASWKIAAYSHGLAPSWETDEQTETGILREYGFGVGDTTPGAVPVGALSLVDGALISLAFTGEFITERLDWRFTASLVNTASGSGFPFLTEIEPPSLPAWIEVAVGPGQYSWIDPYYSASPRAGYRGTDLADYGGGGGMG